MLYKLVSSMDEHKFENQVICLTSVGCVGDALIEKKFSVHSLEMKRGVPDPFSFIKLVRLLWSEKPDLIQTWMYHSDLMGGFANQFLRDIPLVWNIRNSNLDPNLSKKTTILIVKACAFFSKKFPRKIICCAESASNLHKSLGYSGEKIISIPNGFDVLKFKPNLEAKNSVRKELKIREDAIVIGLVGRFDPQKDHQTFFEAGKKLFKVHNNIQFVLCGENISNSNKEINDIIKKCGMVEVSKLLGRRKDVEKITASFDIGCSSSAYGEAFSNAIGEAMACGVPCVVTDVGDSALIVGDTGLVVPPRDPDALYHALKKMVDMGAEKRRDLGRLARDRVVREFSLDRVVNQYEQLYYSLVKSRKQAKG